MFRGFPIWLPVRRLACREATDEIHRSRAGGLLGPRSGAAGMT
jgi:hypothetical protein